MSYSENIRLTIGKTVLEDFDEEGRMMLLCSYPQLHDGATLYQINLPDAIRVNCEYKYYDNTSSYKLHKLLDEVLDEHFTITAHPDFICIENPKTFTVQRFIRAVANFGSIQSISSVQTNDGQQSISITELSSSPSDAVVSSVSEMFERRLYSKRF